MTMMTAMMVMTATTVAGTVMMTTVIIYSCGITGWISTLLTPGSPPGVFLPR